MAIEACEKPAPCEKGAGDDCEKSDDVSERQSERRIAQCALPTASSLALSGSTATKADEDSAMQPLQGEHLGCPGVSDAESEVDGSGEEG